MNLFTLILFPSIRLCNTYMTNALLVADDSAHGKNDVLHKPNTYNPIGKQLDDMSKLFPFI